MKEGCGRSTIRATMTGRSPQLVYTSVQLQLQVRQVLKDQLQKIRFLWKTEIVKTFLGQQK